MSAEWFFSTLAQSTAAAIGFVIAFTASIYTLRAGTRRERVRSIKSDFGELNAKYSAHIGFLVEQLEDNRSELNPKSREEVLAGLESLNEDDTEFPTESGAAWENLKALNAILDEILETNDGSRIVSLAETLEYNIDELVEIFGGNEDANRLTKLKEELGGETGKQFDRIPPEIHRNAEIDRRRSSLESPASWRTIIQDLEQEFNSIKSRHRFESMENNGVQSAKSVLQSSFSLFFIGVIIPIMFLISPPENTLLDIQIGAETIFFIESLNLLLVVAWAYKLFTQLEKLVSLRS